MADINSDKSQESYKGTGKFTSVVGGLVEGGVVGTVGLGAYGYSKAKNLIKALQSRELELETIAEKLPKKIGVAAAIFGIPVIIGGWMAGARAGRGRRQFQETQKELAVTQQQAGQLTEMVGLEREQNKRFTEIIAARPPIVSHAQSVHGDMSHKPEHQNHADKVGHKTHESHAAAVDAKPAESHEMAM